MKKTYEKVDGHDEGLCQRDRIVGGRKCTTEPDKAVYRQT